MLQGLDLVVPSSADVDQHDAGHFFALVPLPLPVAAASWAVFLVVGVAFPVGLRSLVEVEVFFFPGAEEAAGSACFAVLAASMV